MEYSAARVRHALQPLEFALRLLLDLRRHAGVLDGLLQLVELGRGGIGVAELLLNLAQPLAQHRFLLPFVEGLAGLLVDLARHLQHLDAPAEQGEHAVEPRLQIEGGEDFLFLGGLQIHEARDHVGERGNRLDAANGVDQFARRLRQQLHGLRGLFAQIESAGFDLAVEHRGFLVRLDARHQEGFAADIVQHREALLALGDQVVGAVRRGDEAHDGGGGADAMQAQSAPERIRSTAGSVCSNRPTRRWVRTASCAAASAELAGDGDGQHDAREKHRVAHRQNDEHVFDGVSWR